ncbi:CAAX prenyl protease-related protein [bacterium]|nr:CAAX prenyl protease-related protein [bacterium]
MTADEITTPTNENPPSAPDSYAAAVAPAWAYVLPFAVFLVGTNLEGQAENDDGTMIGERYAVIYCVKILAVLATMFVSRKAWRDLKPLPGLGTVLLSVAIGAFVTVFWIGLDGLYPPLPESLGKRSAFDPTQLEPATKWLFLIFRTLGLVAIVPVIEELFMRDFILRYVTDPDWQKIAPWAFNPTAAVVSLGLFVAGHPEWFPALLCGILWLWLLRKSKSVSALVISHAVANLGLGVYSVATGDWRFL